MRNEDLESWTAITVKFDSGVSWVVKRYCLFHIWIGKKKRVCSLSYRIVIFYWIKRRVFDLKL